jgi:putative tricarboxylic transport membrane protein
MVVFGLIGYVMREMDYPVAPMILGIILGDILDKNFRRALVISDGNFGMFFTRPISLILFILIVFTVVSRTRWFKAAMRALFSPLTSLLAKRRENRK